MPKTLVLRLVRGGREPQPAGEEACRELSCDNLATTSGYCRAHYIKNWARIKEREELLGSGTLERYVEEIVRRFPQSVVDRVREDLASDDAFERALEDLDLHLSDEDAADLDAFGGDEPPETD